MSRFITCDDEHGFWISNGLHDLWMMLLSLHMSRRLEWYAIESRIANQWLFGAKYNVTGCDWDHLPQFLAEPGGREVISEALQHFREALSKMPETISADTFGLMGFGYDIGPIERNVLAAMAAAFDDLLNGRISAKAGDRVDIFGQYLARVEEGECDAAGLDAGR